MMTRLLSFFSVGLLTGCSLLYTLLCILPVRAANEAPFDVKLIWGTNGEKPKEPLKIVETDLLEKLKKLPFKWKDYYEISSKRLTVPKDGDQKIKLSEKCEIQVKDLGNSRFQICLFGEGNLILKQVQTAVPGGEPILLGGDSKNDTAWLVVLTRLK